jgi:hypothetical protein
MNLRSKLKSLLALVLALLSVTTGCTPQWVNVAVQDLPVLTQMALNIANLVSLLVLGKQASTTDVAAIQNISAQASRDLNLLQSLYSDYKANPSSTTLQKIQNVITGLNQNLPALLQAAHISNPTLSARVSAAVNLILSTVNSVAQLMPQSSVVPLARRVQARPLLAAKDLKNQWNLQVCSPTGNSVMDEAFAQSLIR